jgi:hypothetical protein
MRILWKRTLALHAVRNGVVLAFLDLKCHGLVPHWLRQGLASYLAQEGSILENFVDEFRWRREVLWSPQTVMQHIHPLHVREEGRIALYNSFLMTWNLAESYGWNRIQDLLDLMEQGIVFEAAVPPVYGVSAERLLELLDPREFGEPTEPKSPLEENPPATPDAVSQPDATPEKPEESPR